MGRTFTKEVVEAMATFNEVRSSFLVFFLECVQLLFVFRIYDTICVLNYNRKISFI